MNCGHPGTLSDISRTAVNLMDQATEQNAAMVEQSTAAAASLASEAGRLRDLVNQFQVDSDSGTIGVHRNDGRSGGNRPVDLTVVGRHMPK